ncbi:hypothetical protein [Deferrisoma palaeochoriense]
MCDDLADPTTRSREIAALGEAMEELAVPRGIVVTREHEERMDVRGRPVDVLPAWRFLLELPEAP